MKAVINFFKSKTKSKLLDLIPENAVVCEIGVWKGEFSERILKEKKTKELHLIDPWKFFPQYKTRWYGGAKARSQKDMNEIYKDVKKRFLGDKNVFIHRSTSEKAAKKLKNKYFDFIYVDGNHSYEFVLADLTNYFPKLKEKGTIAGDDYLWREGMKFPVRKAVSEFVKEKDLKLQLIFDNYVLQQ
jgi:hypothetical protein